MSIISSSDLKSYLGITDTNDDTEIALAVAAASQAVTEWCGRTFDKTALNSETARVFRPFGQGYVKVDDFWDTTNLVVKTDDNDDGAFETTWTLDTDFILQPDNGLLHGQTWPYHAIVGLNTRVFPTWARRPAVQVTAAWGWAAIPDAVKYATLIWGGRLFKRRNSPEGVLNGFADFGIARVVSGDPDVHRVTGLLAPFRHPSVAALVA